MHQRWLLNSSVVFILFAVHFRKFSGGWGTLVPTIYDIQGLFDVNIHFFFAKEIHYFLKIAQKNDANCTSTIRRKFASSLFTAKCVDSISNEKNNRMSVNIMKNKTFKNYDNGFET